MGYARTKLEQVEQERDALKAKLEAAESMCAEMREALQHVFNWKGKLGFYPPLIAQVDKALSSACGTGYKSPAEYAALEAKLEAVELVANDYRKSWEALQKNEQLKKAIPDAARLLELVECKCDTASLGGYTCPRCETIARLAALVKEVK